MLRIVTVVVLFVVAWAGLVLFYTATHDNVYVIVTTTLLGALVGYYILGPLWDKFKVRR
jgi:hypothetical protein